MREWINEFLQGKRTTSLIAIVLLALTGNLSISGFDTFIQEDSDNSGLAAAVQANTAQVEQNTGQSKETRDAVALLSASFGTHLVAPAHEEQLEHNDEVLRRMEDFMEQINYIDLKNEVHLNVARLEEKIDEKEHDIETYSLRTIQRRSEGTLTDELEEIYRVSITRLTREIAEHREEIVAEQQRLTNFIGPMN